jgi:hypothetical protein
MQLSQQHYQTQTNTIKHKVNANQTVATASLSFLHFIHQKINEGECPSNNDAPLLLENWNGG